MLTITSSELNADDFLIATHAQLNLEVETIKATDSLHEREHRESRHVRDKSHLNDNSNSTSEIKAVEGIYDKLDECLSTKDDFANFICKLGSSIKEKPVRIRDKNIRTVPDDSGNYTVFIEINHLDNALDDLRNFILKNKKTTHYLRQLSQM